MKKNYLLLTMLGSLVISGCGDNSTSSSVSQSNTNVITSSSSTVLTEEQKLEQMITELRKGVKFVGTLDQKSFYLDGDHGKLTGDSATNAYNIELTYQSNGENAYSSYVTSTYSDGSTRVFFDNKVFQGEDGYAYYYDLNYDNQIKKFPFMDNKGDKVNFGYYCANPFSYLKAEDFIKVNIKENTYTLSKSKSTLFASNVFGDFDEAFYGLIEYLEFTVEDGNIRSFTIKPENVYGMSIDYETLVSVYYLLEQSGTFEIKEVGSAKVEKPEIRVATSSKEDLDRLQKAFDKIEGTNYTANMKISYDDISGGGTSYATYYYTGEHLYYSRQETQEAPDASKDILLYNDGETYLTPYVFSDELSANKNIFVKGEGREVANYINYKYEDVIPVIKGVSAELFDYNKTFNNYSACNEIVKDIATKAFVPQINEVQYYLDGSVDSFKVKLTSAGDLDYISFSFKYDDGFFQEAASVKLSFTNIGTTELPFDLEIA